MSASVSQSASKGGALAGYETVLGVTQGGVSAAPGISGGKPVHDLDLLGVAREAIQIFALSCSKVDAVLLWKANKSSMMSI